MYLLAQGTEPKTRNIQYRTRPKGPFFQHCATFFKKTLSPRKVPLQFFGVLQQNEC